jgi:antitoxin component YwqK of YwqJK toxin-antitoxin module
LSSKGNFRNGERDGLLEAFSENGEILMKKTFLNGEVISCEYGCNLRTD